MLPHVHLLSILCVNYIDGKRCLMIRTFINWYSSGLSINDAHRIYANKNVHNSIMVIVNSEIRLRPAVWNIHYNVDTCLSTVLFTLIDIGSVHIVFCWLLGVVVWNLLNRGIRRWTNLKSGWYWLTQHWMLIKWIQVNSVCLHCFSRNVCLKKIKQKNKFVRVVDNIEQTKLKNSCTGVYLELIFVLVLA